MNSKFSLRYRVALTFLLLGCGISTAMGVGLYWLTTKIEIELIEETLSIELEDYMHRYRIDSTTPLPFGQHIRAYVRDEKKVKSLPLALQNLPIGLHHIEINQLGYYVKSDQKNGILFFMLYADKIIGDRQNQHLIFLFLGVVLMTFLSGILGFWLTRRVILPVTQLAQQVSAMQLDFTPLNLKKTLVDDEIGKLSLAIEDYHQRLLSLNERERAFTRDVSHELRTPLAVIEGACEVMLSTNQLTQSQHKKIERIMRANMQITRLITALLALARKEADHSTNQQYSVDKILTQVINEHRYLLHHKPVAVKLNTTTNLLISADPTLLYVVLANIIRNAFSYTRQGVVYISLQQNKVVIRDTGVGIKKDQLLKMFDHHYGSAHENKGHGIGLSLVWRICKRYDWKIDLNSDEGEGTCVQLLLGMSTK